MTIFYENHENILVKKVFYSSNSANIGGSNILEFYTINSSNINKKIFSIIFVFY
jgi:hypothetical protein